MTRTLQRLLLLATLAAVAAWPAAQLAHAGPNVPDVPTGIVVPAGHKLFLIGHAAGVQIHTCKVVGGGYAWSFGGPRANLYDDNGTLLATHFGGPSWQARDGSKVVAALDAPATVDPAAIPWLRLKVTSATAGPDGDRLVRTTYIQRIATTGGLAPAAETCNAGTVGTTENVPYTADYTFWKEAS